MHRTQIVLSLLLIVGAGAAAQTGFSGQAAYDFTKRIVAFGPRPSGSEAIRKLQAYILGQLKLDRCQIIQDDFKGSTPLGPVPMKNIIARFPGSSRTAFVISGHYDTKVMPGTYFIGANDGGSSAGFLLEMARVLAHRRNKMDVYLVFFDGEEAVAQWSETDSLYGSRHLAERWANDGTLQRIAAMINVDMIGDRDLTVFPDANSSPSLTRLIWTTASALGLGQYFPDRQSAFEDDHLPFVQRGVNAADLLDFDYGPNNSWWHNDRDTLDKLSPHSFSVVGRVVLAVLTKTEGK